jgi:hypothetical protein
MALRVCSLLSLKRCGHVVHRCQGSDDVQLVAVFIGTDQTRPGRRRAAAVIGSQEVTQVWCPHCSLAWRMSRCCLRHSTIEAYRSNCRWTFRRAAPVSGNKGISLVQVQAAASRSQSSLASFAEKTKEYLLLLLSRAPLLIHPSRARQSTKTGQNQSDRCK